MFCLEHFYQKCIIKYIIYEAIMPLSLRGNMISMGSAAQGGAFGNCLPETELLQSPFRTEFSMTWDHIRGVIADP